MNEDFDAMRERLEVENEKIIGDFLNHTVGKKKMGKKQMGIYGDHLQFFADNYLINYEGVGLLEGLEGFCSFAGDWFIRKCMWADESSLQENLEAYEAFLGYLEETGQVPRERVEALRRRLEEDRPVFLLRVKYYNDPEVELEEILDYDGGWDDNALLSLEKGQFLPPLGLGRGRLVLNLLLSARAAKFFKLKAPQLLKLKDWDRKWVDPVHHWFSNWRCEECFSMEGTEKRVFIVSNEATRFSFLFSHAPGDIAGLFKSLHGKLMESLKKCGVGYPSTIELQIATLSGAAPSLTGFQNNILYYLDCLMERGEFEYLDDLEPDLNRFITTIEGEYRYPVKEFARRCGEDPPFLEEDGGDKIIPFLN